MTTLTRRLLQMLLLLLILMSMPQAWAGTYPVLAPQAFVRGTGAPVTETRTFTVQNPALIYTINVYNGGLQDNQVIGEYVSASEIKLNGVLLFGPNQFNQNTSSVTAAVSVQPSNTLTVELRGKPGGTLTLEVLGIDNDAPTITATVVPAANAAGWNSSDVTVTFACSDALSDVATCPAPVQVSAEGANQTVSGTAVDVAGNSASATVTVNLDTSAPVITAVAAPSPNAAGWNSSDVTVTFSCSDALSGVTTCPAPVQVSAEGANQNVSGTAVDVAGNTASASIILNLDTTPPEITAVATPLPNAAGWNNSDVTVNFICSDVLSGIATCPVPSTLNAEGANQSISDTAVDVAGNTATAGVTVHLDKTPPQIAIGQPVAGSTVTTNPPTITVTYSDNTELDLASFALTLNGAPLPANCTVDVAAASCVPNSALPSGMSVTVGASIADRAGSAASTAVTFTAGIATPPPVSASSATTISSYNNLGLVASIDGPRTDVQDISAFEYDAQGNLATMTNALGQVTQMTAYDANGRPLTLIDVNGVTTTLTYDPLGRLLSRTMAGQTTTFTYDKVGQLTKTTLPDGSFLQNIYGAAHRLGIVTDNLGNKIQYTYDLAGNRTKEDVKDPDGVLKRTLSRTYNNLSQLTQTVGGAGQTTTFTYDANGNQTGITVDPGGLNQATTQAFDALNRVTTSTDALNGITTYIYDARNNLTSVTDPKGLTTTYTYDGLNRVIQQQNPDTGTTAYTYDAAGNRTSQIDARGVTSLYTYDALNRLTLINYPDTSQNVSYTYDSCTYGVGRLCTMQDNSGTTAYAYDTHGNLVSETITQGTVTQSIQYTYDSANRMIQMTYPSGRTVDYARNSLGQVTSVTTTQNAVTTPLATTLAYQPFGPMNSLTYGNGLAHSRSYDQDYRLTAIVTSQIQSLTYTLNAANNITAMINTQDSNRNQSFSYDKLNRLTGATGIYGTEGYTYDANGNRLTSTLDGYPETYTYATTSHHLLETVNGGTRDYTYDGNGNTTDNGNRQFTYGDNNRLKEAQIAGAPLATYTYNGKGERVKKAGLETTLYFYDLQGQLIAETDGFGNTQKEYLTVDGQPMAQFTNGMVYFIHTDHLGTPQLLTDNNQAIVWSADYMPFGSVNITTETVSNNLRFPGQYYDQETNLHYNMQRYYDTQLGRYITSDRIGLKGGLNTYEYVKANPVTNIDPDGEFTVPLGIGIIAAIGVTAVIMANNSTQQSQSSSSSTTKISCPEPCLFIHATSRPIIDGTLPSDVTQYPMNELTCWYACPTKGLVPREVISKFRILQLFDRLRCIIEIGPIIFE